MSKANCHCSLGQYGYRDNLTMNIYRNFWDFPVEQRINAKEYLLTFRTLWLKKKSEERAIRGQF